LQTTRDISQMNLLTLAFVGDAVQELQIKTALALEMDASTHVLQKKSVGYLCCEAQAAAARSILEELTEEELSIYKRARNAKVSTVPKHATVADYHAATAIEAVIGYCYLKGERDRAAEIIDKLRAFCDAR